MDAPASWTLPEPFRRERPDAAAAWAVVDAAAHQVMDPALLDAVGARTAHVVGAADDHPDAGAGATELFRFAEQFAIDVQGAIPMAGDLASHVGADRVRDVVTATWVVEFASRLRAISAVLFGPSSPTSPVPSGAPVTALKDALDEYQNVVVRGRELDIVTTELVRLRCGRSHHCRICQTLRLADAREAGVDDAMTAKIDRYETSDLPERSKLALRLTDAVITRPDSLSPATVAALHAEFSDAELVELCLDVSKWSTQKIHVALGLDGIERLTLNEDGTTFFGFDDDGAVAGYWPDARV